MLDNPLLVIATSILGALAILLWRIRETQRPISPRAGHPVPPRETASVFFLLAFGMIVRWRVWMYRRYRAITRNGLR